MDQFIARQVKMGFAAVRLVQFLNYYRTPEKIPGLVKPILIELEKTIQQEEVNPENVMATSLRMCFDMLNEALTEGYCEEALKRYKEDPKHYDTRDLRDKTNSRIYDISKAVATALQNV